MMRPVRRIAASVISFICLIQPSSAAPQWERPFVLPPSESAGATSMETTLRVDYAKFLIPAAPQFSLNQPQCVEVRCYNGSLVGPTLRIRPGIRLKINIDNRLPQGEKYGDCVDPKQMDNPHGFNCTNLHTHGLHVSPEGHADNVFVEINPGCSYAYEYKIPCDHVAGTFWYHPHKHGSVALQVTSGMAGALIVEGGLDDVPAIRAAKERIMVVQQLTFRPNPGHVVSPDPKDIYNKPPVDAPAKKPETTTANVTAPSPAPGASLVTVTMINGQVCPAIQLRPGEIERWRFIGANVGSTVHLAVVKDDGNPAVPSSFTDRQTLYEIAVDGIPRGKMVPKTGYGLNPGYRWDVLFRAPSAQGNYLLVDLAATAPTVHGFTAAFAALPQAAVLKVIAKIAVKGRPRHMRMPHQWELERCVPEQFAPITDREITDPKTKNRRICYIEFTLANGKYMIDQCEYDPSRIDRVAILGRAEEWHLKATKDTHPFHIHVNPFEQLILDADFNVVDHIWRDTLLLSPQDPTFSTVRMRFKDFTGKTVLHCHRLDHEDQGMMENFVILPQGTPIDDLKIKYRVPCQPNPIASCNPPAANQSAGMSSAATDPKDPAPDFDLPGTDGKQHRLSELPKGPTIICFFRGLGCLHCVEQLQALRDAGKRLKLAGISVVAISTDTSETLTRAAKSYAAGRPLPFLLLADGTHATFKKFDCFDREPMHGTFVLDAERRIRWRHIGNQPFMDISAVIERCREARNTSATRISRSMTSNQSSAH